MASRNIPKPTLSDRQRSILDRWTRNKADVPYQLIERCNIVLMSADGISNTEQGRRLGIDRQRVRRWRQRWLLAEGQLAEAEAAGAEDKDLRRLMLDVLSDAPRTGRPPEISAEQVAQIMAMACEVAEDSGRPVTHWTARELADEAHQRGIVESISARHVSRLLKRGTSSRTRVATG